MKRSNLGKRLQAQRRARRLLAKRARLEDRAEFFRRFVSSGDLCFDIGANIGQTSVPLAIAGARVIAVEPGPEALATLRVATRGLDVTIVEAAAGAAKGSATLYLTEETPLASLSKSWIEAVRRTGPHAGLDWTQNVEVPVRTLDSLVADYGMPSFIKIDVEGSELDVLRGLSKLPPALIFEHTAETPEATAACIHEINERSDRASFSAVVANTGEFISDDWLVATEFLSLIEPWSETLDVIVRDPGASDD